MLMPWKLYAVTIYLIQAESKQVYRVGIIRMEKYNMCAFVFQTDLFTKLLQSITLAEQEMYWFYSENS